MGNWSDVTELVDSLTLTGSWQESAVLDYDELKTDHALHFFVSASPGDAYAVSVQGSMDSQLWHAIGGPSAGPALGDLEQFSVVELSPFRYIKVRAIASSGSPVVTVLVASRD